MANGNCGQTLNVSLAGLTRDEVTRIEKHLKDKGIAGLEIEGDLMTVCMGPKREFEAILSFEGDASGADKLHGHLRNIIEELCSPRSNEISKCPKYHPVRKVIVFGND